MAVGSLLRKANSISIVVDVQDVGVVNYLKHHIYLVLTENLLNVCDWDECWLVYYYLLVQIVL